jgi:hypothetical protein
MTTATLLTFQPLRSQPFLNDEGNGSIVLFFGQVGCPQCLRPIEVQAEADGECSGYCPSCGALITVSVDMRPLQPARNCDYCDDPECRAREAV